ncbi:UNVERIFIED_ORG: hypothetical protein ABIC97_003483 [Peribacillus simplex]
MNRLFSLNQHHRKTSGGVRRNIHWMDQGGAGTIGWFKIYKDGRVVEE